MTASLEQSARRHSGRGQRGFTLMELMLAVALLGLIMVMLWGSFSAVVHSKIHAENRLASDQAGLAIMCQLSKEIRGLAATPLAQTHVMLVGEGHTAGGYPVDGLTLSTFDVGHRRSLEGFGAEEIVTYTAFPNPDRGHRGWFVLMRTQQSALLTDTRNANAPPPLMLADNLLSLHLRYFDGSQWRESWNSQIAAGGGQSLPQAVSIDLKMATEGGRASDLSTTVTVPIAFTQR